MRIDGLATPAALLAIALALLLLAMLAARRRRAARAAEAEPERASVVRGPGRRAIAAAAVWGVAATALTVLASLAVIEGWNLLGVGISWPCRIGVALGIGIAAAGARLLATRGRRALAAAAIVPALLGASAAVNSEFGRFRTAEQLVAAIAPAPPTDAAPGQWGRERPGRAIAESAWTPPADLPESGQQLEVDIPATASGFPARPASIWLPPAALVPDAPALPVMILLAGQPGDPQDLLNGGELERILEDFQHAHHGLAPIVVSPDQLGDPAANPLCVDGALGNSRTYLETDVVDWIRANLPVAADRTAWTFGGFSQGATCTLQIGLADPDRYALDVAIAPELVPSTGGSEDATIAAGFGGDRAAYEAATPAQVMQREAPYRSTRLIVGSGDADTVFTMWGDQVAQLAAAAGLDVERIVSPGTSHDFNTVRYVLERAVPEAASIAGLATTPGGTP